MIYFFWQGALEDMLFQWLRFNIFNSTNPVVDLTSILMIALLPSLIFIYAIYKTFVQGRFTNYQVRVQQVMFIMFLAALGTWWFSDDQAPYELLIFLPSFAFFINHLLFQFKSKKNAEVFILSFSILLIGISYSIYYQNSPIHKYGDYNKLTNQESVLEEFVAGKSVMILGGSPDLYSSAEKISTRFYHPTLSTEIFNDMNNKEQLMALYDDIIKNQPEVIIDFLGYFSKTKTKMPSINKDYVQKTQSIYTLTLIKKSDSF